jgi:hypothetical protein
VAGTLELTSVALILTAMGWMLLRRRRGAQLS